MKRFYESEKEITTLTDGFKNKELTEAQWTHEAHLTVGIWFLKNYDRYKATCRLRSGIIELNVSLGGKNTPTDGYHETITLFWIWLIRKYIEANPEKSVLGLCNAFLNSKYADRNLLLNFYSREVLFSIKARAVWVEPDKKKMAFPF